MTAKRVDASDPVPSSGRFKAWTSCWSPRRQRITPRPSSAPRSMRAWIISTCNTQTSKLDALRAHEREINEKKLCFVTEAGYHPGLPSAMIRYAASKLDCIESARTAGYLNMGNLQYTEAVDELMERFIHYQAQVYRNGAWTKPSSWDMRKFDFGEEVGTKPCYSMFFEELHCIPDMYPTLKDTGFYISGSNLLADLLLTPIIMVGLKIAPKHGIRPLGKLMWWAMSSRSRPIRWCSRWKQPVN